MASIKDTNLAFDILSKYNGKNYLILSFLRKTQLNDFEIEYIIKNHNKEILEINKNVKISEWYSEKLQKELELDFSPKVLKIIKLIGETSRFYHCLVKYRQNAEPKFLIIPKNGILTNFLVEDYKTLQLDFSWFDKKLQQINHNFSVMPHQKEAAKFLLTRKKCILSLDMGLGKSMSSIIASLMYGNKKVLVICPASIKTNWKNELLRFVDEDKINIIKGFNEMNKQELIEFLDIKDPKQYKVEELRNMAKANGKWNEGKQFTILNFDIIDEFHTTSKKQNTDSDLLKSDFDVVIIDEAHKLSNNTSTRFKTIKNYLNKAKNEYTWLLTGTMLTNDVKNLYNLLSLIENDITGDYNFYMEQYCGAKKILKKGEWDRCWNMWNKGRYESYYKMNEANKKVFKDFVDKVGKHVMIANESNNLDELKERIDHLYYRKTKEEIIPVDKIIVPCIYNLTEEQKNEYNSLWEKYETEKREEGKDVSEIKQLVSVAVNRQYISKIMVPNTIKLTDKLLEKGKKVFIVCCYDEELYTLHEYFGDKSVIFNGKMNQKQKDNAVEAFNNDDNVKILIGNIAAVGVGINLNKSCNHAIFQNLDFTDAAFSQACDRIYRIGSKENAYIYLQYFKDTVYEHIVDIITRKKKISEQVIKNN
jgi:SWI/SNF-related matrix-associated actin-dependent regulator 1 of chromatin subfamily A